jgi:recombination associated protein RdgC
MWFKSVSLYRLSADFTFDAAHFEKALKKAALKPIGPLELQRRGFVSPFGPDGKTMLHEASKCVLFELVSQDKVLPSSVVKDALEEKYKAIRARTGRNPGKRQREQLKDEVLTDLLPRAFAKSARQFAYVDLELKYLVLDSASDKACEALISTLREGLEGFVAEPIQTESSPSAIMSEWLARAKCDGPFVLGDEVELKDPVDTGCAVRAKRHDLEAEEIREHVRTGKKVSQLALVYDNRMTLVLDEKFKLRKLRFLDVILEAVKADEGMDAAQELDARFTLMALEFRRLFGSLDEIFKML